MRQKLDRQADIRGRRLSRHARRYFPLIWQSLHVDMSTYPASRLRISIAIPVLALYALLGWQVTTLSSSFLAGQTEEDHKYN
jgi:hypothetical protein